MMRAFSRLVLVATLAGLSAGALVTLLHHALSVPLILRAELLEAAAASQSGGLVDAGLQGAARFASTALIQALAAIGFSLLLLSASVVSRSTLDARRGLAWGLAGFAVFFLAPALGLPPTLPGTEDASLQARQLWWLLTVLLTGAGLAMAVFGRFWMLQLPGVLLVLLPHVIGAPQPRLHASLAPMEWSWAFVATAAVGNLLFWLALGALTGFFHARIRQQPLAPDALPVGSGAARRY
jgi:cobalt transporter subunit CbtA